MKIIGETVERIPKEWKLIEISVVNVFIVIENIKSLKSGTQSNSHTESRFFFLNGEDEKSSITFVDNNLLKTVYRFIE